MLSPLDNPERRLGIRIIETSALGYTSAAPWSAPAKRSGDSGDGALAEALQRLEEIKRPSLQSHSGVVASLCPRTPKLSVPAYRYLPATSLITQETQSQRRHGTQSDCKPNHVFRCVTAQRLLARLRQRMSWALREIASPGGFVHRHGGWHWHRDRAAGQARRIEVHLHATTVLRAQFLPRCRS